MKDVIRGVSRASGVVIGFLPIATSFGAIAVQAGVPPWETIGLSIGVYAGASQFAAIEAVRQGLPWVSIVLTIWVINLRHIPMSLAATRQIYSRFAWGYRWLLAHGLIDETFALEMSDTPQSLSYYLGMHLCCWASWVIGTWLGCQVGLVLPDRWLQFALPGLFLYLLIDILRHYQGHKVWIVVGFGILLVLATESLGSTGILLSIIGVAGTASLLRIAN